MSRTYHHGFRARERKFGKPFWGHCGLSEFGGPRYMKWPKQVDYITAAILGEELIATPPKRRKGTWHVEWMRGSRGHGVRSRSHHFNIYFYRPERAHVRDLIRRVLSLRDLLDCPEFPDQLRPVPFYW